MDFEKEVSNHLGVFFWNFKRGDNTIYNFQVLKELYAARKSSDQKHLFNKPITVLNIALIECILYDFLLRIKEHTREKIPGLTESKIDKVKNDKKVWKKKTLSLNNILPIMSEHNLLNIKIEKVNLYKDLVDLNKIRNRVHIQNELLNKPLDESSIYNETILKKTEFSLKLVIAVMMKFYSRPRENLLDYKTFPFPWLTNDEIRPAGRTIMCTECGEPVLVSGNKKPVICISCGQVIHY